MLKITFTGSFAARLAEPVRTRLLIPLNAIDAGGPGTAR